MAAKIGANVHRHQRRIGEGAPGRKQETAGTGAGVDDARRSACFGGPPASGSGARAAAGRAAEALDADRKNGLDAVA